MISLKSIKPILLVLSFLTLTFCILYYCITQSESYRFIQKEIIKSAVITKKYGPVKDATLSVLNGGYNYSTSYAFGDPQSSVSEINTALEATLENQSTLIVYIQAQKRKGIWEIRHMFINGEELATE